MQQPFMINPRLYPFSMASHFKAMTHMIVYILLCKIQTINWMLIILVSVTDSQLTSTHLMITKLI
jgi:hypothetical protein